MMAKWCEATPALAVPLLEPLQEDGYSCVPRCVKMILMYVSGYAESRVPDYDLEKIAKIFETRADGTYPEKVLNINRSPEIVLAKPSIEFDLELKYHRFEELLTEIEDGQPPIVWVTLHDKNHIHSCAHAIVITNIEDGRVFFNDPMFGKQSELVESFITRWDEVDRIVIKVKIGKKKQRMLEEFENKVISENQGKVSS
jgi:hypothetical protein